MSENLYRLSHDQCNQPISYIMVAVKMYAISIYIHENNSEHIYQLDDDSPIVHLIKTKLEDGSDIYLPTEERDDRMKVSHNEKISIKTLTCVHDKNKYKIGNSCDMF